MRAVKFRTVLGIYLLFLAVYLLTGSGHFRSTDEVAVYLAAQSLVEDGSLAIRPMNDSVTGVDGKSYNQFGTGQSIASIPFYLVGRAVDQLNSETLDKYFGGPQIGDPAGTLWGGTVPIFFVSLFNQFVTPLTCVVVYLFCLVFGFSLQTSFLTTLVFGFSTSAWVYSRDYFQHPLESFLLLFTVYVLYRHRDHLQWRHALLAGVVFALGLLTRVTIIIAVPPIVLYLLFIVSRGDQADSPLGQGPADVRAGELPQFLARWRQRLARGTTARTAARYLLASFLPVALACAVLFWVNHLKFGHYLLFHPSAGTMGLSTPFWLGLYGDLFSVGRSIFLYSPPVVLALFAYPRFFQQRRAEATLFTAIVVAYLASYSVYFMWDGGWCYGPRFLVPVIPFLVIPLGYILEGALARVAAALLAVLGVGVQILGVAINYSYVYWDWRRMNLSPETAFLFVPDISPIPTHLKALLEGRHVDLWVLWVYQQFGPTATALTLALPLALLVGSFILLTDRVQRRSIRAAVARSGED